MWNKRGASSGLERVREGNALGRNVLAGEVDDDVGDVCKVVLEDRLHGW